MLTVNAARLDASDPCKTSQVSLLNIWAVMRVFRPSNQRASRSCGMLQTSEKNFYIKLRGTQWTWFNGSDVYASSQSSHVMLHPEGTSHEHFWQCTEMQLYDKLIWSRARRRKASAKKWLAICRSCQNDHIQDERVWMLPHGLQHTILHNCNLWFPLNE